MPSKKRATPVSLQPLDALFGTNEETTNGISEIAIGSLHPFTNHPFQVRDDKKMEELAESITQYGVLVPGIVRLRESGGYELVAGHRRKRACELSGLEKMPVIIKDLTDDEATVIMVDSNIQREELLISEKAFAYKMKYEALKRQGKRSDLTSCQVGKKLAAEEVSQNTGDSSRQILRYIHLTELVAELLELADEKKLPFNTAVELSYLRTEEQQILFQYMSNHNMVPSLKQAKELKQISKERMLTYSEIDQICMNESTEKVQVQIPAKKLKQYFPETYTKTQMEEIIFMLVTYGEEAKNLLEDLQSRNERMFLVTVLVMNTAKKRQKLENNIFQVQGIAQKYNCSLKQLDYQQEAALMSCIPLGVNRIEIQRGLTTSSTAIFVPFTTQELFQEGEALYYGLNALSNNMIMVDRKRLKNPNGLILGTPGSGKSFSAKREITNCWFYQQRDWVSLYAGTYQRS